MAFTRSLKTDQSVAAWLLLGSEHSRLPRTMATGLRSLVDAVLATSSVEYIGPGHGADSPGNGQYGEATHTGANVSNRPLLRTVGGILAFWAARRKATCSHVRAWFQGATTTWALTTTVASRRPTMSTSVIRPGGDRKEVGWFQERSPIWLGTTVLGRRRGCRETEYLPSQRIGRPPVTATPGLQIYNFLRLRPAAAKMGQPRLAVPPAQGGCFGPKLSTFSGGMVEGMRGVQIGPGRHCST